jgi:hypothetical protein
MTYYLLVFLANVRNLEGEFYSKSTMIAIRQGIRRYLQEPPFEKDFDIIKDPRMNKTNAAWPVSKFNKVLAVIL